MIRLSDSRGSASLGTIVAVFAAGALLGALTAVEVVPADQLRPGSANTVASDPNTVGGDPNTVPTTGPSASAAPGQKTSNVPGTTHGTTAAIAPSKFECRAGANGGATDRGVTATQIKLATTIVTTGVGESFLREMQYAMDAVVKDVNTHGGICGRTLSIVKANDNWDANRGHQFLNNYINDKSIFGIPVGASSEGLRVVIANNELDNARFPAIGTDGLAVDQYAKPNGQAQPWVWPVATATVSSARIMADYALEHGSKAPGVVFDKDYKFGAEAAAAFSAEVKRKTGKGVPGENTGGKCQQRFCALQAGQPGYGTDVSTFYDTGKPDFVALFLEPQTALAWMQDANTPSATELPYHGAQPLFTKQFESQCRRKCDQMVVWSGFKPYIDKYVNDPAVRSYVSALKTSNRQADEYNQFTESAYAGMQMLVQALRTVGPEVTRDRLKAVLDVMSFSNGLTIQPKLSFSPGNRFANTTMQAFVMQYKGQPGLWRLGPVKTDPRPQVD